MLHPLVSCGWSGRDRPCSRAVRRSLRACERPPSGERKPRGSCASLECSPGLVFFTWPVVAPTVQIFWDVTRPTFSSLELSPTSGSCTVIYSQFIFGLSTETGVCWDVLGTSLCSRRRRRFHALSADVSLSESPWFQYPLCDRIRSNHCQGRQLRDMRANHQAVRQMAIICSRSRILGPFFVASTENIPKYVLWVMEVSSDINALSSVADEAWYPETATTLCLVSQTHFVIVPRRKSDTGGQDPCIRVVCLGSHVGGTDLHLRVGA